MLYPDNFYHSFDPPPGIATLDDKGRLVVTLNKNKKHVVLGLPEGKVDKNRMFETCHTLVDRMKRRGFFDKPWILIPLNFGDYHWAFVALLNMTYIGSPQDKKFSGFLYYDSFKPQLSRTKAIAVLHNKGILNMICYANLVCGNPVLDSTNIRDMLLDPKVFPKLEIPKEDFVEQHDGCNCGLFVFLNMMDISLVHSFKYQKKDDFQEVEDPETGQVTYYLHQGEWYKLFSVRKPPGTRPLRPSKNDGEYMFTFFSSVREQLLCLWNRIHSLKAQKNITPQFPKDAIAGYFQTNHRQIIWGIDPDNQELNKGYNHWVRNSKHNLKKFLLSKNKFLTEPEKILVGNVDEDSIKSSKSAPKRVTEEQLKVAGVTSSIVVIDDDDNEDDEAVLKKLDYSNEEEAKLPSSEEEGNKKPAGKKSLLVLNYT